jgi:transposase InsO family protein
VIHHNDRGAQYGSVLVGRTLREAQIIPSMGRVGDPWDKATNTKPNTIDHTR